MDFRIERVIFNFFFEKFSADYISEHQCVLHWVDIVSKKYS